jgi:Transposase DDE domain group 1
MDSTEVRVYGEQGQSVYHRHFALTCYHALLLFNREGDCLAAKLRPGDVHSAEVGRNCCCRRLTANSGWAT